VGQLIHHKMFDYRGVIVGVDPRFSLTDEWYEQVARSRPPKDAPWYHVLVHGAEHTTYVAERNLEPDESLEPVEHPLVSTLLGEFDGARYLHREIVH
jgi:heat shock protein HspQ